MKLDPYGKINGIGSRAADLILLNLLYILCCLPIFTIGAATSALYYITLKMAENRDSHLIKSFFYAFRMNFRQATLIWLGLAACFFLLFLDFRILASTGEPSSFRLLFYCLLFLPVICLLFIMAYIFPLLARFQNSAGKLLKIAFFMSLKHLPWTLLILFLSTLFGLPLWATLPLLLRLLPFLLLAGFSLPAFLNSLFLSRIFARYLPKKDSLTS